MPTLAKPAVLVHQVVLFGPVLSGVKPRRRELDPAVTSPQEILAVITELAGDSPSWGQVVLRMEAAVEDWSAYPSAAFSWEQALSAADIAAVLEGVPGRDNLHWHLRPEAAVSVDG